MNDYTWAEMFRQCWEKAVAAYRAGGSEAAVLFNPSEQALLASIGCTPHEMYDFAEDADELSFESALLITAVRRDYFHVVQKGRATGRVTSIADLPPKDAALAGFVWLPRIIAKARAKLAGELPVDLMYGCGGDRAFCQRTNIHPADFLRHVWAAGDNQQRILEYVQAHAAEPRQ